MSKLFKTKEEKRKENEEAIVNVLDSIDIAVKNLTKFGEKYDSYIDEAALRGDDRRARQLISQKVNVFNFIRNLQAFKSNVTLGAYTAMTLSSLEGLPRAIKSCKGLLAQTPDFSKLSSSMKTIFDDIDKAQQELAKLGCCPQGNGTLESRLLGDDISDDNLSEEFKTEYAAMMSRVKAQIPGEKVASPAATFDNDNARDTGAFDYAGIIEEEKKK